VKKTFIALLVSAVAVWGYVVVQVVTVFLSKGSATSQAAPDASLPMLAALTRPHPALDTTFRDPFLSYLYVQKPAPPAPKGPVVTKAPLKVVEPPKATVNGILWGDPPVAILQQDGVTELVKAGAEIWGLKVLKIDRHEVVVQKDGRKYSLAY
jgi:hypothetical protein